MLTTMIATLFVLCAGLALAVIAGSLTRALPLVRALRRQMRGLPETRELRTRITAIAVTRAGATIYRPDFAGLATRRPLPALRAA